MSHAETEAQALLRSGALYPERVGLQPADGTPLIFVGLKHGALSIYLGDDPSYHFDLEGRWNRCYVDPSHYLRRLDGSTQAIDRPRHGGQMLLERRTLGQAEAAALDESIRLLAIDLRDRVDSGALEVVAPPEPARAIGGEALRDLLGRIARWDAAAWHEHRRRHAEAYGPMPVLPPDSLDALVLQATVARPGDGSSDARSPEDFAAHCRGVAELLGEGVIPYRNLFLSGADVLRRPPEAVEAYLRIALDAFPLADSPAPARRSDLPIDRPHREGVHAMLGRSAGPPPSSSDWPRYRTLGLRRVSFGVACGEVPGTDDAITPREELPALASGAVAAGIAVSVVVRLGPSDAEGPDGTASLIRSLGLGKGDHVYLVEDDAGADRAAALMAALAPLRKESGAKVLPYSVRKQGI